MGMRRVDTSKALAERQALLESARRWGEGIERLSEQEAADRLAKVRAARRSWKAMCDAPLRAARATVDAVRKMFREVDDVLAQADMALAARVASFAVQRQETAAALREQADTAAFLGDEKGAIEAQVQAAVISTTRPDGVVTRELWSAEVVDVSRLPREYMVPDMVKLNAAARRLKEAFDVPGARAVKRVTAVVR